MIQINDKIRITRVDERNLQIEEYRKVVNQRTNQERNDWVWVGYYGDLKSAINGVITRCSTQLVDEEISGCKAIIERLDKMQQEFRNEIKVKI